MRVRIPPSPPAVQGANPPASPFFLCTGRSLPDERERPGDGTRNACIGALLAPAEAGGIHVAIIVEDTLERSSAQDATCIGPGGKVGRESVYLADLFHIYEAVRFGVREAIMRCLDGAVGAADQAPRTVLSPASRQGLFDAIF